MLVNFYTPSADDHELIHETRLDILGALPSVGDEIHIDDFQGVVSVVRWRIKERKHLVAVLVDEVDLDAKDPT
ncbi:MAG: hypothetical protein AAGF55_15260 [Pseudomonadota bacterium]